ncbi:MAG: hypothetical protein ACOC6B_05430 [Thermodesulfobacteriota bacterium]
MENQERDAGSIERETSEARKHVKEGHHLTIMIFKKAGTLRTITISSRLLLGAAVFLGLYIVGTIFITNAYFDAYRITEEQETDIAALTEALSKTRLELKKSKRHLGLLQAYLQEKKEQTP